jgi:NAD+ synthase
MKKMLDKNYNKIASKLSGWIKDKVEKSGADGVVSSLDGQINSAVTSLLCQKACPANNLTIIISIDNASEKRIDAITHAEKHHLNYKDLNLKNTYLSLISSLNKDDELKFEQIAQSKLDKNSTEKEKNFTDRKTSALKNIIARLRMTSLYYYANLNNYLVVGNNDQSEIKLGYFTKYGDGAFDIDPLATLVKLEVKGMARSMEIDSKIIAKTPTNAIWPQTISEQDFLSYRDTDYYFANGEAKAEVKNKIQKIQIKNKHKSSPPLTPNF